MRKRRLFQVCILCCALGLCQRSGALVQAGAEGGEEARESVTPVAVFASATSSTPLHPGHHQQVGEEQQRTEQAEEEQRQRDEASAFSSNQIPSLPGDCTSFVQSRVNADEDVSCFSHNANMGCRSPSLKVLTTNSVVDCLKECRKEQQSQCTHYTWNKKSKRCHLKSAVPRPYTYDGDMTGPRSCDTSCHIGCLTYNTAPMQTLTFANMSTAFCQTACMAVSQCEAFVYEGSQCKLFSRGFADYRTVSGTNTLAGPKTYCEAPSDLRWRELRTGSTLGSCLKSDNWASSTPSMGGDIRVADALACQKRCAANSRCTHYTYNTATQLCYIKPGEPNIVPGKDDVTALRDCVPD